MSDLLTTNNGTATLLNIVTWKNSLMLKLSKYIHFTEYIYIEQEIRPSTLENTSITSIQETYPPMMEINKEAIKEKILLSYELHELELQREENREIKTTVHKLISKRLLEYEDAKPTIASIIFESISQTLKSRLLALECSAYILQEPHALYRVIIHLVRPSEANLLVEQNEIANELNEIKPLETEDLHGFCTKYATKLKTLITIGHKETIVTRATFFLRSLAHKNTWRETIEREDQIGENGWYHRGFSYTHNCTLERFEHVTNIILNKLLKAQNFNNWVNPQRNESVKALIHTFTEEAHTKPTETETNCPWCTTVLKINSKHQIQDCYQIQALMKKFSSVESVKHLCNDLRSIADRGAIPRYNIKERKFTPFVIDRKERKPTSKAFVSFEDRSAVVSASNQAGMRFLSVENHDHHEKDYDENFALSSIACYHGTPSHEELADYVILDSGCDHSVIADENLLYNITSITPQRIQGLGSTTAKSIGDSIFGRALYVPTGRIDLLSQSQIIDEGLFKVSYDAHDDVFRVYNDTCDFTFNREGGLYVLSKKTNAFRSAMAEFRNTYALTATAESVLPIHAQQRAKLASTIHVNLGHPNDVTLARAVDHDIADTGLTSADIKNMRKLYGPCQQCLEGKDVQNISGGNYRPATMPGEILHIDLIQIPSGKKKSTCVIMAVDELTTFGLIKDTVSKTTTVLYDALLYIINWFRGKGTYPKMVRCDAENALKALAPMLGKEGIWLDARPPGEHEKYIEARIRHIRARMRAIEASMEFKLPMSLSIYLLKTANYLINLVPSARTGQLSPYTLINEARPSGKILTLAFGQPVMVTDPTPHTAFNNREERANMAIYLGPSETSSTSGQFLILTTRTVKQRALSSARAIPHGEHIENMIKPMYTEEEFLQEGDSRVITNADRLKFIMDNRNHSSTLNETASHPSTTDGKTTSTESDTSQSQNTHNEPNDKINDAVDKGGELVQEHRKPDVDDKGEEDNPDYTTEPIPVEPIVRDDKNSERNRSSRYGRTYKTPDKLATAYLCSLSRDIEKYGHEGVLAAKREITQILDTNSLEPTPEEQITKEEKAKSLHCKLFIQQKRDGRTKARFVGGTGASSQDKTLYPDLSSPTVRFESIMLLLKGAASKGEKVAVADIPGAYLHAEFVDLSLDSNKKGLGRRFIKAGGKLAQLMAETDVGCAKAMNKKGVIYLRLRKALYGLIESAKLWHAEITNTMLENDFYNFTSDPCVFEHKEKGVTIGIYVDDIIILYQKQEALDWFLKLLEKHYGDPRVQTEMPIDYLNATISIIETDGKFPKGTITLSQKGYIQTIMRKYPEYFAGNPVDTPYDIHLFTDTDEIPARDGTTYVSVVMSLVYVCTRGRPDIFLAISYLCTRVKSPSERDVVKLKRVCAYLKGTIDKVLVLTPSPDVKIVSWVDASYAIHDDAKGHTGIVISVGEEKGSPVFSSSRKQKLVARSSTEAELIGLHDASPQVIWTKRFVEEMGYDNQKPKIMQDNKSTISMAERGGGNFNRTKHIAVRYFAIKQLVEDKQVDIEYAPSREMLADPLTKPIVGATFLEWRDQILFDL